TGSVSRSCYRFGRDGSSPLSSLIRGIIGLLAPCGVTTGDSSTAIGSLGYSPGPGRYTFMWQSDKSWAGSCREFVLVLRDGTTHSAFVGFRCPRLSARLLLGLDGPFRPAAACLGFVGFD